MPTIVKVTNLDNGRTLVVRINDRGPFVNGRIIDLSRRSAQMLGIEEKGTARVRVQVMADESRALAMHLRSDGTGHDLTAAGAGAPREQVATESLAPPPGTKMAAPRPVATLGPKPSGITNDQRMDAAAQEAERKIGQVGQGSVYPTNIFVQAGTFSHPDNAKRLQTTLSSLGQISVQQVSTKGQLLFRVRIGPFASAEEADKVLDRVIAAGQQDAKIIIN